MPVEALNAVPALARRSAQRGLEAIQAAVAAKAVQGGGGGRRFLHGVLDGDGAPGVASRRRAAAGISADLGHPLTRPSMSELAQVISYEAYAPHRSRCRHLRKRRHCPFAPPLLRRVQLREGALGIWLIVSEVQSWCACSHRLKSPCTTN